MPISVHRIIRAIRDLCRNFGKGATRDGQARNRAVTGGLLKWIPGINRWRVTEQGRNFIREHEDDD